MPIQSRTAAGFGTTKVFATSDDGGDGGDGGHHDQQDDGDRQQWGQ